MTATTLDPPGAVEPPGQESTDRELLEAMVAAQVGQNRAHAARLDALSTFHRRRVEEREGAAPESEVAWFRVTPLRETQSEAAPLTGVSEQWVQIELDTTMEVQRWLPRLWERFRAGRIDLGRATACLDQMHHLADDEARTTFAARMQEWFDKHDPLVDAVDSLCTLTRERVRRAAYYQRLRLPQRSDQETFAEAYRKRRVTLRLDEQTGMAAVAATVAAHDALTADHRLTLIAKRRAEAPGETRTLAQLRADSLLDLIHGRMTVPATTGDLEHHQGCDRACHAADDPEGASSEETPACPRHPLVLTTDDGAPFGGYARPVVAVTVPITSLIGLSDEPGVLSGGSAIPADLARHIAGQPGSTWYRLLTDERGEFQELSTTSYQPTDPLWRTVVTREHTCVWPGCRRPSVHCELDHRVPYPVGATSTQNLAPLCRRHHRVKHADGYGLARNDDGSHTWTTRHGSTLHTAASEQPAAEWPRPSSESIDAEFTAITSQLERTFAELVLA